MPASPAADAARLRDLLLEPGSLWTSLEVVEETGSTNADLSARARAGAPSGTVLVSEHQAAGRGRLTRTWTAPPGTSIAMSFLLHPTVSDPGRWGWLPLLTGLSVSEGLRRACGVDAWLKWPNDVLVAGRKVSGILAERVETPDGPACVIGCGINVSQSAEELPTDTSTSLTLQGASTANKSTVIATVLRAFELLYGHWHEADDDISFADSYLSRCTTIGRRVRLHLSGRDDVEGTAEAVDAEGRLRIRTDHGSESFAAGDIVHLR